MDRTPVCEVIDPVRRAEHELAEAAGAYLHNTVRDAGVTCAVCATPVSGCHRCLTCERAYTVAPLSEIVVPLIYGIKGSQSAGVLRGYKDDPLRSTRAGYAGIVNRLLFLGITLHERCVERQAGQPIDVRLTIPSVKNRPGPHPFTAIARRMNAISQSPCLAPRLAATHDHSISARHFRLTPDVDLTRRHVLLLDDTWTSGASAHSAALTLRRAGAQRVSIMVVGRWLAPGYARNARFIEGRLHNPYDPRVCPVTGGRCP
jgi:hypothetical protein